MKCLVVMAAVRKSIKLIKTPCMLLKRNIDIASSGSRFNNNFNYVGITGIVINKRFSIYL